VGPAGLGPTRLRRAVTPNVVDAVTPPRHEALASDTRIMSCFGRCFAWFVSVPLGLAQLAFSSQFFELAVAVSFCQFLSVGRPDNRH